MTKGETGKFVRWVEALLTRHIEQLVQTSLNQELTGAVEYTEVSAKRSKTSDDDSEGRVVVNNADLKGEEG